MRKLFAAFVLIFSAVYPIRAAHVQSVYAQGAFSYTGSFDMDAFLEEFTETYPDRSGREEKPQAALYLAQKFFDFGYGSSGYSEVSSPNDLLMSFPYSYDGETFRSSNVVAVKRAAEESRGTVIIGAHYDNVYSFELLNPYTNLKYKIMSMGAYDNGSGVAVMMSIAHDLRDAQLPFDVVFVAFGAEELGLYGSKYFVNNMSEQEKKETLLMINLDCIAAGDYLYLFSKDWNTPHDGWLRERAEELSIPLRALPLNKKYMYDAIGRGYYSHYGYYSDNYYFMKENLNTAFFMTMNWESKKKAGVVESDLHNDIMHTRNDDYKTLKQLYPDTYLLHMEYVSELVSYSLKRADFADAMAYSRENTLNPAFITEEKNLKIMGFSIWIILVAFAYFYYGKLRKRAAGAIKEYMERMAAINDDVFGMQGNARRMTKGFSVFGSEFDKEDESHEEPKDKDNTD